LTGAARIFGYHLIAEPTWDAVMTISNITRRRLLLTGATATGMSLFGMANRSALAGESVFATVSTLQTVGIQLYTVRDLMAKSVADTLEAVAKLGYREVEFAGYYGHAPAELKTMLADTGLSSPSTHVGLTEIRDNLDQTLDTALAIGHDYVVLAYLAPGERTSLDDYMGYVELFSRVGEAARERGLQFGYHNHDFEFVSIDGVKPYDLMLQQIDAELMKMTLDLFWIHKAGGDPYHYFGAHPGRFKQCHVKDMNASGEMVDVGAGVIDFASIFANRERAGFEHYYVEHDRPEDSLLTAANSIQYLNELVF
jgi:sugar phosphate isomerase/epimerase